MGAKLSLLGEAELAWLDAYRPPTLMHRNYCAHCPSKPGMPSDEETDDVAAADFQTRLESVFHCGWRYGKACRGICERVNITAEDLHSRGEAS